MKERAKKIYNFHDLKDAIKSENTGPEAWLKL
jgi:hypothetical protein